MFERTIGISGVFILIAVAWLISEKRRALNWKTIISGVILQWIFAFLILRTSGGQLIFAYAQDAVNAVVSLSDKGAIFLFGQQFEDHFFAFKVLPTIIFISALSTLMFHWGLLQHIVDFLAWIMHRTMGLSGSESLVTSANIFLGQTEAPLLVKPYILGMTRSEILVMMGSGMASVAGGVLAAYVGMGISAGHLLAASVMSAPACIVIAKIMLPETEQSQTSGFVRLNLPREDANSFAAACRGASEGLLLALNVGAMLIAFIGLVELCNLLLGFVTMFVFGEKILLQTILGYLFWPFAFIMGIPQTDCYEIAQIIGQRMVLNEFVAYKDLAVLMKEHTISERSASIATYAICGFANFSSIAIQIGGIGSLEPRRKKDFAELAFKSMICGTLAGFMTACIAGVLL